MSRSAERAQIAAETGWNFDTGEATVPPGSDVEARALARIDELREMDMAGRMQEHPDFPRDASGGFYRSSAGRSERRRRRSASERYWRRAGGT